MQLRQEDAAGYLQTHHGVLGPGWKEVQSFEDIEDEDEYEDEEVVNHPALSLDRCHSLNLAGRVYHAGSGEWHGCEVPPNGSYIPAHRAFTFISSLGCC